MNQMAKPLRGLSAFSLPPLLWLGGSLALLLLAATVFAPLLSSTGAYMPSAAVLESPSWAHPLGTDSIGRDIMARVFIGLRSSFLIVGTSAALAVALGGVIGMLAAYFGGPVDWVMMRLVDIFLAVPTLLLAVAVLAAMGPSAIALTVVLVATFIPHASRVVRVAALQVTAQDYVASARVSGIPWYVIVGKHILPNVRGIVFVQMAVTMSYMLVIESSLSFLGLGVPPPAPSIGYIIAEGRQWMEIAPWPIISASSVIVLLILATTFIGQGLDQHWGNGNRVRRA